MNVIYKTNPRHTEDNVKLDQVIEVIFMVDINQNTVNPENIMLLNLKEQKVEPVKFTYARKVLKVTPTDGLAPNGHYQLQLVGGSQGLKDITGRGMAQTMDIEFTTRHSDTLKPPVVLYPTDVSVVKEAAMFKLKPVTEALYYELEVSESNTFHNVVWPTGNEKVHHTDNIEVTPNIPYKTGLYYMRVRAANHEEEKSAWSDSVRFFYDGAPVIEEAPETPFPEEPTTETEPAVILQAKSQVKESNQLASLQQLFVSQEELTASSLMVKSSKPKDGTVNNSLERFNSLIASGNQRKIVVEFTEAIDSSSITAESIYILAERN